MRFDYFLVALVVFVVVFITGTLFIADINTNYGSNIDTSDFGEVYNITNQMYNTSQDMENKTLSTEISDSTAEDDFIKGSISSLKLVTQTFSIMKGIINGIANTLNIPPYFVVAAITAISLTIIVSLIYLFIARSV